MAPADVTAGWCFLLFLLSRSPRPGRGSGQRYGTADGKCERGVRPGVSPTRFRKPERGHGPPSPPSAPCWRLDRPLDSWGVGGGSSHPWGQKDHSSVRTNGSRAANGCTPGERQQSTHSSAHAQHGLVPQFPRLQPSPPNSSASPPPPTAGLFWSAAVCAMQGGGGGPFVPIVWVNLPPPPPRAPCSRAECPLNPPAVVCTAKCCPDGFLPADPRGGPAQTAPRRRAGCRHSCNVMARCCAHTHTHTHTHVGLCTDVLCAAPRGGAGRRNAVVGGERSRGDDELIPPPRTPPHIPLPLAPSQRGRARMRRTKGRGCRWPEEIRLSQNGGGIKSPPPPPKKKASAHPPHSPPGPIGRGHTDGLSHGNPSAPLLLPVLGVIAAMGGTWGGVRGGKGGGQR